MSALRPRYNKPGSPAGTRALAARPQDASLSVFDFRADGFQEERDVELGRCAEFFTSANVTWVHVQGSPGLETLRALGSAYELHPLALEDVATMGQRPKAEAFEKQLFTILNWPRIDEDGVESVQVSLFLGRSYVISFCAGKSDPFEPVRERIRAEPPGRIRERGAHFLFYALMDLVIDEGFPALDALSSKLEELEEEIIANPNADLLDRIHGLKRSLIVLRKSLWPQREVVNSLLREEHSLIDAPTRPYLRDCYDHAVQVIDLIESYRDMASSLQDLYMSSISNRMNEVMKVLTIIASIFIPLSFLAGLYGMNFDREASPWNMPELGAYYGYPIFIGVLIVIAGSMLALFRWRRWI